MERYDFVVIGSGSAGAVLAGSLAQTQATVLLLEAGGPDDNPAIWDPSRLHELWGGPEDWRYTTVAQEHAGGRELPWPRGRVLGGSSAMNGMNYVRGDHRDYDHWAYLGNPGWAYEDVLPIYRSLERFDRGPSHYHGADGPLEVIADYEPHPLNAAAVAAAMDIGIPFNDDRNGSSSDGTGLYQLTLKDGRRHSAAAAFLAPVRDRVNLTIETGAHATRLLFDQTRCTGVEYTRDGAVVRAEVGLEVIVSAGVVESPRLLMLSGLGPARPLGRLGIPMIADLPGVGSNVHDHVAVPLILRARRDIPLTPGLPAMHSYWSAATAAGRMGIGGIFFHVPLPIPTLDVPPDAFTIMAELNRPHSRGTITLTSTEPHAPLRIDPQYLSCRADVEGIVEAVELCREIAAAEALREWCSDELFPGPGVRSDADLRAYARANMTVPHHPVGSCKMGLDDAAVVDASLNVHGVQGLRVADASIMPDVTTGNTHAPSLLIGAKAAELVRAAHGLSPATRSSDEWARRA